MIVVAALLLAQAPATLLERAKARLSVPAETRSKDARYRVEDGDDDAAPDGKTRALGVTGRPCSLVGARVCTRKPRTWVKAPLPR